MQGGGTSRRPCHPRRPCPRQRARPPRAAATLWTRCCDARPACRRFPRRATGCIASGWQNRVRGAICTPLVCCSMHDFWKGQRSESRPVQGHHIPKIQGGADRLGVICRSAGRAAGARIPKGGEQLGYLPQTRRMHKMRGREANHIARLQTKRRLRMSE